MYASIQRLLAPFMALAAVGVAAPAFAQTSPEPWTAEQRPAQKGDETEDDKDDEGEAEVRETEYAVETTVEFETEKLTLPSADALLSGKVDEEPAEQPRAPRAVIKQERIIERPKATPSTVERPQDEKPSASDLLPTEVSTQAPGDSKSDVDPRWKAPEREENPEPQAAAPAPPGEVRPPAEIGARLDPVRLEAMADAQVHNVVHQRLEHLGTLRSKLDLSLRELRSSATFGRSDPAVQARLADLERDLAAFEVELQNLEEARHRLGERGPFPEIAELRARMMIAGDHLEELRAATDDAEFASAAERLGTAVGSMERQRAVLRRELP